MVLLINQPRLQTKWPAFLKGRIEAHPINISCVAYMFGIKPRTLHFWYKHYFSGFPEKVASKTWWEKTIKIADKSTGEVIKEKQVPLAKQENVGTHMTIDEKMIGKKMYTVMTNLKSTKLAFIAESQNGEELKQAIREYFPETKRQEVTSISSDMNATYKRISKELFPNAVVSIDKFHVIMHILDALQTVRKQVKAAVILEQEQREAAAAQKAKEEAKQKNKSAANSKTEAVSNESPMKEVPSKESIDEPATNGPIEGVSELEYLERSRYILCKREAVWELEDKSIMGYLFDRYPILGKAYALTEKIRNWYDKKNIRKDMDFVERDLYDWFDDVIASKIPAFRAVRRMMEKHYDDIINYFREGHTNAKAENMNGKIQRFMANNFGIRDRSFFFFRLVGYFS